MTSRASVARTVKIPQHLFWGHLSGTSECPRVALPTHSLSGVLLCVHSRCALSVHMSSGDRRATSQWKAGGRPSRARSSEYRGSPPLSLQEPQRGQRWGGPRRSPSLRKASPGGSGAGFGLSVCFCWPLSQQWGGPRGQRASHLGWVLTGDAHKDRVRRRFQAFSDGQEERVRNLVKVT